MHGYRKTWFAGMALFAAATALAADKRVYPIQFERDFAAGQVFTFTYSDSLYQSQKIATAGGEIKHVESVAKLDLDAELKIINVNEKGRETEQLLTIHRFVQQSGPGVPNVLLKPDTQIRITHDAGKVSFDAVKGELPQDARGSLRQIFPPHIAVPITDDERFGTAANKGIGDSWPLSAKAIARGAKLLPENVSGTVTLKDVKPNHGIECAELVTDLQMKDLPVQDGDAKENTLHAVMTYLLPTDASLPRMALSVKLTTHTVAEQPSNSGVPGEMLQRINDTERTNTTEWIPIPRAP